MTAGLARRRALTVLLALALALTPLSAAFAIGPRTNTEVVSGDTAIRAALGWSQRTFANGAAQNVLLGRDDRFPDNLASGAMQGLLGAPLLLNPSAALHADVSAELKRLGAQTVHILGGTGAVSQAVEDQLKSQGYRVRRVSGTTRIETAITIAREHAGAADTAIVARAFGTTAGDESAAWADALGAGAWAAATGWPVLLTQTEQVPHSLDTYLRASGIKKALVIGGTSAVSSHTVNQLAALGITVERVSGANRFETATRIAARRGFDDASKAARVILAEGEEALAWAGGFTAAAHAKVTNAAVVLSNGDDLPPETEGFLAPGTHTTALWCGPFTTSDACDAAGTQLDQSRTGVVTLNATTLPRDGSVTGKVAPTADVTGVTVRGDCVASQQVTLDAQGAFSVPLRAASDATSCTVTFTVTHRDTRTVEQSFSLTLTDAPQVSAAPELLRVDTVSPGSTTAPAQLRFVFDERVGASDGFTEGFTLFAPNTSRRTTASAVTVESAQNSVLATFPVEAYTLATLATVESGAVENLNDQPNAAAAWPLKARSNPAGRTDAPDLVSVGNFTAPAAGKVRADFTFDTPVNGNGPGTDHFGLVLADGSVLESTASPAVNGAVVTAEFTTSTAAATLAANTRRAWVTASVVNAQVLGAAVNNPYTVVEVASGGATTRTDLASVSLDTANSRVTYVFDDAIGTVGATFDPADFLIVHLRGVETVGSSVVSSTSGPPGSVTVQFPAGSVNDGVVSAQVREDAVTTFSAGNQPDSVPLARTYPAGTVFAPRLVTVADEVTDVPGPQTRHRLTFTFSAPVEFTSDAASGQPFFVHTATGVRVTHATPCVPAAPSSPSVVCDFFVDDALRVTVAGVNTDAVRNGQNVGGSGDAGKFGNPAESKRLTTT